MQWRVILFGGAVLVLAGCSSDRPTELKSVKSSAKLECRNGMVIHVGFDGDSTCVDQQ